MAFKKRDVNDRRVYGGVCKISRKGVVKTCNYPEGIDEMYKMELRYFVECVRDGRRPITNEDDGIRIQAIAEAIYKSAERGEPIDLGSLMAKVG